jgi:DegV family protein with EDD domain
MAGGKNYLDGVDISPSEAYELFLADPDSFNTSAASPEECLQVFRQAARIAESILCVTASSKLTTVFNSAINAKEVAGTEFPETKIEVFDSYVATPSEGMITLAAAREAAADKDLHDVISAAEKIRAKVHTLVFLDTIRHVFRSGRIPKIASQIGAALNIKPILTVSGTVHFAGMVRSRKQGIDRIISMMQTRINNNPVHIAVMHAYAPEDAEKLKERVAAEFNCVEIWLSEFSPLMGYACGTGTVGLAFYTED